ncbi:MAG: 2-hydroxyacyl-CoA dehydratase family protein, partial [Candidatus Sumerlaeota bacterium]|nr:2-hydroxyacyl-CoA dehydratase family protein [Candidatus Sumerlaeota bacterium]
EMLAIHFCSDRAECGRVLDVLLAEVRRRAKSRLGVAPAGAARVFWVNPVSDLRVMNLLEDCGGRLCGTDFMFCHALTPIPEFEPPMKALARTALADPMVGSTSDRAWRLRVEIAASRAEALVVSRIPGASHCATEGAMLLDMAREPIGIPAVEIEIPSVCDALEPTIRTRWVL